MEDSSGAEEYHAASIPWLTNPGIGRGIARSKLRYGHYGVGVPDAGGQRPNSASVVHRELDPSAPDAAVEDRGRRGPEPDGRLGARWAERGARRGCGSALEKNNGIEAHSID